MPAPIQSSSFATLHRLQSQNIGVNFEMVVGHIVAATKQSGGIRATPAELAETARELTQIIERAANLMRGAGARVRRAIIRFRRAELSEVGQYACEDVPPAIAAAPNTPSIYFHHLPARRAPSALLASQHLLAAVP